MGKRYDGGPAFPTVDENREADYGTLGMSLRDYAAIKAMQSILAVQREGMRSVDLPAMATDAYAVADAMLEAREQS